VTTLPAPRRCLSLLVWLLSMLAFPASGRADEPHVLVLRAQPHSLETWSLEPWPEGAQAVIAELALEDRKLVVRSSHATSEEALIAELELSAAEPSTVGAVAIVREGSTGIAYVWTRSGAGVVRVQADASLGTVAESAVALRVAELLRARTLEIPIERKAATKAPEPRTIARPEPTPLPIREPMGGMVWASGGAMLSSGAKQILPMLSLGARYSIVPRVAVEGSVAFPLGDWEVRTEPGTVRVDTRQVALHALVSPVRGERAELSVGIGGGMSFFSTRSFATGELVGREASTRVGVLGARALGALRDEHLAFLLFLDGGILLPSVTLRAAGNELVRLGSPWVLLGAGVGFGP
jgi:hypothetical protein